MPRTAHAKELACDRRHDFAPRIVIRRFLTTLLVLCCCATAGAQIPGLPQFSAQLTDTDPSTGDQVLTGNARLDYEGILLTADEIRYNLRTQTASARGHVVLTIDNKLALTSERGSELLPQGAKRLLADEIIFELKEKKFSGTRLRFGEYPLFIEASRVEGTPRDFAAYDAKMFYREPGLFGPTLTAEKISVVSREKVVAEKARLGTGNASIIPFRCIDQNVHDPIISHISAKIGRSGTLGYFADLGLHLPFAEGVNLGGDLGLYSSRGILFGPSGTYDITKTEHNYVGEFNTGYIHDNGNKGSDILGRPIHSDRGFIQWQNSTVSLNKSTTTNVQLNYWTDSYVARDFRPDEFNRNQQPDTFYETTHTSDNAVSSTFFRIQPNTFYRVQQRLPELRTDYLPSHLGLGIYNRSSLSLAALRERAFDVQSDRIDDLTVISYETFPTVKSNRIDWLYALERPVAPREWLVINPVAAARLTHYFDAVNGRAAYSRFLGELGADASLRASGVYNYKNERWGIDGIRHLITPKLSYRYIPSADRGKRYIPQVDDRVFDTALPTLELADQRNIDDLESTNVLRVGLDNTFQTRDATYGSRDLLTFNIAGDYRFRRNPGEKDVSSIHTGISLTPARWLRYDVYNSFTPQNYTLREFNNRFTILDGNVWLFSIANHYLQHQIDEYIGEGRYRINEVYSTVVRLHYDARRSRFNEQSLTVHQNLNNIWSIQYGIRRFEGRSREGSFGYQIGARLMGL